MLKVAVSTLGDSVSCIVPPLFEDATHLLIVDAETDELIQVVDGWGLTPLERCMYFAAKVVELDCEALLCGELEQEPFAVLAEENCVTRYLAAERDVLKAVHMMNAYALPLITDFAGGAGCPDNDPANCDHHEHG